MAIVRAIASGNWSNTAIWSTGALPTSADDVYSNTFTVTIDISPTVLSISNAAATGVTAGGTFVPNNGITLTCTATIGVSAGSIAIACFDSSLTSGQSCTVVANCNNGTVVNAVAVRNNGTGTVNVIGNCTCTNQNVDCILNNSSGTLNITGNCTGGLGSANPTRAANNNSTGIMNITGTCTGGAAGGANSSGAFNGSSGTLNITGPCVAGNSWPGAHNNVAGLMTVTGTAQASNGSAGITGTSPSATLVASGPFLTSTNGVSGIYVARWFWANSNVSPTYYQIRTQNLATIRPLYTADSVGGNPAVGNVRSGTVYGPSNELTGTCAVPGASSVLSGVPVDNTTGTATISAASIRSALGLASANLDSQLASAAADSSGVTTLLGRLTSGRAANLDNLDTTISSRLAPGGTLARVTLTDTATTLTNAPTVPSAATIASAVRTELATELARLDAAISTRLASSSYTTAPTAAAIATAVNSALDRTGYSLTSAERSAIATAVEQSILNEGDGQQVLNAIVGAIGNTNVDQIALVAAIRADLERTGGTLATRSTLTAAQVRTELTPELANLDATVSSRLPSSGYTAPPSAASIASAVWANATRTLTTAIDNSSTIAAAVWSAVTRTLSANPGPSAADNAAAVWGYNGRTVDSVTNATPVDAAEIAEAVRTELTPELARMSNAATTQEVGDIVEEATNQ